MAGSDKMTLPTVTLMTDFGTRDHYVACMKGVILQVNANLRIVDVTHDITPHGIVEAAFILRHIWPWFPPGTVHVVVVDPGVGTGRRILIGRYSDRLVIAPDNGNITLVHRDAQIQELRSVEARRFFGGVLSPTFHGRDVMAPVAAHVASGVRLHDLGPLTDHLEILNLPQPKVAPGHSLIGEVLYVDHFGNLITNITAVDINNAYSRRDRIEAWIGDVSLGPIHATYSDVSQGEPLALFGSTLMLEIAVNQGNAAVRFAAGVGTRVEIRDHDHRLQKSLP